MQEMDVLSAMVLVANAYKDILPYTNEVCHKVMTDPETDVQAYVVPSKDGTLHIIFRGSNSPRDWDTNLNFWKKKIPYKGVNPEIQVHSGFIDAYTHPNVRDKIHSFITEDIHSVRICGHSYGAALAVLCALDLQYHFPCLDIEVVTFGGPRVGNKAFQRSYNARVVKTIRVENGNDIVTKVPFAFMGYWHVGAKLHVGKVRKLGAISFAAHYQSAYYEAILNRFL